MSVKHDKDKPRYTLIPPGPLLELAKVMTYGAEKYEDDGWVNVVCREGGVDRYLDACYRHIEAYRSGEVNDESGLPHLAHAMASVMIALWGEQYGPE
jgi:hypothetical protein